VGGTDETGSTVSAGPYDGPTIATEVTPRGASWIWVANGSRSALKRFAPPPVHPKRPPRLLATPGVRPDLVERVIASFRSEALELDLYDPLIDQAPHEYDDDLAGEKTRTLDPAADTTEAVAIEVRILGPVEVVGWPSPPERAIVTELLCYLTLHRDRSLSGEAIRAALRPEGDREQSAKTMRTYLSSLRRSLGPEAFPAGAGYRLSELVTCDWEFFRKAAEHGELDMQLEALRLVRGRPFEGVRAGTYGWVFAEFLVSDIEVAVSGVAKNAADECHEQGRLDTALWSLRQGLLAAGSDFGLWERYLSLSAEVGPTAFARAEREASTALGDDAPTPSP
jgi:hypothetical protein